MDPASNHLNNLILGVCHLCERTRELAKSGATDTVALLPVREAVQMVSTTLEALGATWEPAMESADSHPNWLLGGDSPRRVRERGEA